MKRVFALALALALVACLSACKTEPQIGTQPSGDGGSAATFSVGFGRVNITPMDYSVPISGYGNTSQRMSTGFINYLYTTCIAMTDAEGNTVLLFHNDLQTVNTGLYPVWSKAVSEATGVPAENIMFGSTHTHSGPDLSNTAEPTILKYRDMLPRLFAQAAVEAMADRAGAEMYIGSTHCPNLNYVRHYLLSDGSYIGSNFGDATGKTYVAPATQVDDEMQLIRFDRQDAKDIILMNWQTHPTRVGGDKTMKKNLSSDIIGVIRDVLEAEEDCLFAYFIGAAGNINCRGVMPEETIPEDYIAHGTALADYARKIMQDMTKVQTGKIQVVVSDYTANINHSEDHLVEAAREVYQIWTSTNNAAKAVEAGKPYGINSQYHARSIISRSKLGEARTLTLYGFSIGEVAFAVAPYEMFCDNGMDIKENSPFKMTFIVACANGDEGYMPTEQAFDYGSYEANTCLYERGIAENLADHFLEILNELYAKQ